MYLISHHGCSVIGCAPNKRLHRVQPFYLLKNTTALRKQGRLRPWMAGRQLPKDDRLEPFASFPMQWSNSDVNIPGLLRAKPLAMTRHPDGILLTLGSAPGL